jgi:hypothetical protein
METEDKIKKVLKGKELFSTVISDNIKEGFYKTLRCLEDMERTGDVEKIVRGRFTLWRLK